MSESCNGEILAESIYAISILPAKYKDLYDFAIFLNDMSIFGLARHLNIDLMWHIEQKMRYNKLRSYNKHEKQY